MRLRVWRFWRQPLAGKLAAVAICFCWFRGFGLGWRITFLGGPRRYVSGWALALTFHSSRPQKARRLNFSVRGHMERCPNCSCQFEAGKHRYSQGFLHSLRPMWPSTRIAETYTVCCPQCRATFVSRTLKLYGFVRYIHVPWLLRAANKTP